MRSTGKKQVLSISRQISYRPMHGNEKFRRSKTTKIMKKHLVITFTSLIIAVFGLFGTSCSDMGSSNTHQMGPPGKEQPMGNSVMPNMAR